MHQICLSISGARVSGSAANLNLVAVEVYLCVFFGHVFDVFPRFNTFLELFKGQLHLFRTSSIFLQLLEFLANSSLTLNVVLFLNRFDNHYLL